MRERSEWPEARRQVDERVVRQSASVVVECRRTKDTGLADRARQVLAVHSLLQVHGVGSRRNVAEVVRDDVRLHLLKADRVPEQIDALIAEEREQPRTADRDSARRKIGQGAGRPGRFISDDGVRKVRAEKLAAHVELRRYVERENADARMKLPNDLDLSTHARTELDHQCDLLEIDELAAIGVAQIVVEGAHRIGSAGDVERILRIARTRQLDRVERAGAGMLAIELR